MSDKKMSFEEALKKLELCAEKLRGQDTTLEEAMKNYEEGLTAYRDCRDILEEASQKIETLTKQEG